MGRSNPLYPPMLIGALFLAYLAFDHPFWPGAGSAHVWDEFLGSWTDEPGEPGNSVRFYLVEVPLPGSPIVKAYEGRVAIRNLFGKKVPVSSTKSMTGHLLGGAGGLEAGVTVLALRDQILPPTVNLENQDPETDGMDFVPNQARKAQFDYAMSNSFGFGGTNGALLFKRWE